ncbi:MAG: transglutaminase family protein [Verrucomicrobiae bacterium]|nr:transglutaminase family protein [Verrucomicrobiae bacterium]
MRFSVNSELEYNLNSPATFLFALRCLETGDQTIISESLVTTPEVNIEEFHIISGMNRFSRIRTRNPGSISISYRAEIELSTKRVDVSSLIGGGTAELNPEGIPFLFPSRYCQSDRLRRQANAMFGHLTSPHSIASCVSDWIYENIAYVSGSSDETSSAVDTLEQRQGVCRDFAHLGIAMCRALNVPARYATVYAYQLCPQDFHACFEIFIGGWWYLFDPTRLAPLNGFVRIATGRDAADAAVCTIFGDPQLTRSTVSCELEQSQTSFTPVTRDSLVNSGQAIALL